MMFLNVVLLVLLASSNLWSFSANEVKAMISNIREDKNKQLVIFDNTTPHEVEVWFLTKNQIDDIASSIHSYGDFFQKLLESRADKKIIESGKSNAHSFTRENYTDYLWIYIHIKGVPSEFFKCTFYKQLLSRQWNTTCEPEIHKPATKMP